MIDVFLFIVSIIVVIRTVGYGFWTLSDNNISGSIFIFLLALITSLLSVYLLISGRT